MTEPTTRLYNILYPNHALVASQLDPEQFAMHYRVGSTRFYSGRLIFCDVDINYRNDYFDIENQLKEVKTHEDGRPKATRFISSYRVLEHIDFSAIGDLYLTTPEGHVLTLKRADYDKTHEAGFLRTFLEITPLSMLVMSKNDIPTFAKEMTSPEQRRKGAPKMFFTQIELDVEAFLDAYEKNPFAPAPIPEVHPAKLRDAAKELRSDDNKTMKGLSLSNDFGTIAWKHIRHGFVFASEGEMVFYPMPTMQEIEKQNTRFALSMR